MVVGFVPALFGVFSNGHTIEAVPEAQGAAGGFAVDGVTYTVAQLHFHDPCEHTVDGKSAPVEMHIVGTSEDGRTAVVPADAPLARYTGPLTTPPCTEGVLWDVYLSPATVSPEQLAAFRALYPDNHRPTQPLNGREVTEATETMAQG